MNNEEQFRNLKQMIADGVSEDEQTKAFTGYTKTELRAAFELIENKSDWKASIDSYCTEKERAIMTAAVEFFTATTPQFYALGITAPFGRFKLVDSILRITALGYRMGPAGDH